MRVLFRSRKRAISVTSAARKTFDLPVEALADRGVYVLKNDRPIPAGLVGPVSATLHGFWGFKPFQGPEFALQFAGGEPWRPAKDEPLTPGRDNPLTLRGVAPACVASISVSQGQSRAKALSWEVRGDKRSEEHTSELQSLMRISYAVFCLKKKQYK